jgi:hypothetical protein
MTTHVATIATQDKARIYTQRTSRDDFIPLAIDTYDYLHPYFDSFFTSCLHANIARHEQTSLVPPMLIFYYRQQMSIALQGAQAIAIFQRAAVLNHNSSFLPHIPTSAPTSITNLW